MSDTLRISGKGFALPDSATRAGWKFESRPGGWLIATSPEGERIRMAAVEQGGKLSFSFPYGSGGSGELAAKSSGTGSAGGAGGGAGGGASGAAWIAAELKAQFPGKVRKILVTAGGRVSAGDPLLLIEAMKMEFAVKAPVSGTVTRLRVAEGQQLQPGDQFLDLEPAPGPAKEGPGSDDGR